MEQGNRQDVSHFVYLLFVFVEILGTLQRYNFWFNGNIVVLPTIVQRAVVPGGVIFRGKCSLTLGHIYSCGTQQTFVVFYGFGDPLRDNIVVPICVGRVPTRHTPFVNGQTRLGDIFAVVGTLRFVVIGGNSGVVGPMVIYRGHNFPGQTFVTFPISRGNGDPMVFVVLLNYRYRTYNGKRTIARQTYKGVGTQGTFVQGVAQGTQTILVGNGGLNKIGGSHFHRNNVGYHTHITF